MVSDTKEIVVMLTTMTLIPVIPQAVLDNV